MQGPNVIMESLEMPTLVRLAENDAVDRITASDVARNKTKSHKGTLAGIVDVSQNKWNSVLAYSATRTGAQAFELEQYTWREYSITDAGDKFDQCSISFTDPHQDVLQSLNLLMFYSGQYAAIKTADDKPTTISAIRPHLDVDVLIAKTTEGYIQGTRSIFHTNYSYFVGAAIVELLCVLFILPT